MKPNDPDMMARRQLNFELCCEIRILGNMMEQDFQVGSEERISAQVKLVDLIRRRLMEAHAKRRSLINAAK